MGLGKENGKGKRAEGEEGEEKAKVDTREIHI